MSDFIFVSSVQKELQAERQAVRDFVREMPYCGASSMSFSSKSFRLPIAGPMTCTSMRWRDASSTSDCSATNTAARIPRAYRSARGAEVTYSKGRRASRGGAFSLP